MRSNAQWADFLCRVRNRLILPWSFFDYSDFGDRRAEREGGIPRDFAALGCDSLSARVRVHFVTGVVVGGREMVLVDQSFFSPFQP